MNSAEVFIDAFGRLRGGVQDIVDGLTLQDTMFRLDEGANSIGWLVWHLTRVQDDPPRARAGPWALLY